MIIYGTALLAVCHLLGIVLGDLLGRALGMTTNVGGVGIAMLLLILARVYLHQHGLLNATSEGGVNYWGAIYIPVVVAMAMQQNVVAALRGGWVALLAAAGTVLVCGGCDKNMPGGMIAMLRMNVPGIYVYGGTIKPGKWKGQDLTIVSAFEAVGAFTAALTAITSITVA